MDDVPSGLFQVFLVGLGNLLGLRNLLFGLGNLFFKLGNFLVVIGCHHGTLNLTLYSVHGGYPVLIPLTITGVEALSCVDYYCVTVALDQD